MEIGLEVFLKKDYKKYKKFALGVLCNQASVDKNLQHISALVTEKKLGLHVACLLGVQHGIRGEKQDNMVESEDCVDPLTRLPVYSLYSHSREPSTEALDSLDAFLVDLQDVGTRIYTFVYSMANCMRAAKAHGKKVIVLDRPNPINGETVEGNVLETSCASFVGQFPIVVRHGMTVGELAQLFNTAFGIGCDLEVIPMKGWKRGEYFEKWDRDWVTPSANVPSVLTTLVFPGSVLFEGTNISEGRGTVRPFEYIGAPFIDDEKLAALMNEQKLPGVYFRPIYFQPMFQKWKDLVCRGVQIHVTDRDAFCPYRIGLRLLAQIAELYPYDFQWKQPPYEYEHKRMPIDLISGTPRVRELIDQKGSMESFEGLMKKDEADFLKLRKPFLLYR